VAAWDFDTWLASGGLFVLAVMGVLLYGERRVTARAYAE
jgi:hypothetical protein